VVLVHGLGTSSLYIVPTAVRLAQDFRVYAPDLPGFGHSDGRHGRRQVRRRLPELAAESIQKLPPEDDSLAVLDGHGTTLEELRDYYRTTLTEEAVEHDRESHEAAALEALRDHVRVDVPVAMIDREIDRQLADLEYRLSSLGLPLDRYLEMSGQTMDALRAERRDAAASRVRLELALDALAVAEGIEVDETQVEREARAVAEGRRVDAGQRKRLADLARRDLRRRAAGERLLEIVSPGTSDFIAT